MSDFVEEEDFAALLEASLGGAEKLNKGQTVDATVVKISGDWVFIDTGRKGEGVLSREEFLKEDGILSGRFTSARSMGRPVLPHELALRVGREVRRLKRPGAVPFPSRVPSIKR